VDSIAVIIIKNKHVVVACTGRSKETAWLVLVDLIGNPLVAGNGRCIGAELALGQEKRRIRGSGGVGCDGIEDFVRKVGNGEVGGQGHDGRGQDRGAVGQGWEQKDGWVAS